MIHSYPPVPIQNFGFSFNTSSIANSELALSGTVFSLLVSTLCDFVVFPGNVQKMPSMPNYQSSPTCEGFLRAMMKKWWEQVEWTDPQSTVSLYKQHLWVFLHSLSQEDDPRFALHGRFSFIWLICHKLMISHPPCCRSEGMLREREADNFSISHFNF